VTFKYFNVKNGLSTGNIYLHSGNSNIVANTFIGNLKVTDSANLGNAAVANFFVGDGGYLSNISVNSSNIANLANLANSANIANLANLANSANLAELANIANIVSSSSQPNITSVGSLVTLHVLGDTTLDGNLTVNGTVTAVNSTIVEIDDLAIVLANDASSSSQANGAGVIINGANANMLYNSTSNAFVFSHKISADGSLLSNIAGANVTGAVSYATTANSVAGANVSGQVANALVASTVYTNAQPNITSVGTLTSANISGNLTSGNANLGNLAIANYFTGGNLKANSNVEASNTTTGALQVVGGAGITGNVFIGGILTVTGDFQVGNLNSNGNIINNGFVTFTQPITVTASNAAISTTTGAIVTSGGIGAAGNIFAGGDLNIAGTANIGNLNANVLNVASITTGTGTGGNISGANWVFANYFSGSGNNLSNIQVGNITGLGNLATLNKDGNAGNILYGNGVFAAAPSGSGTYGNSNVSSFLASFGSNTIVTTGNITAGNANLGNAVTANYFVGNGSLLTGIAKATSADSVANGNSNVNILTANGNVTIAAVGNTVATITGTGVNVAGYVTATGNITGGNANLGNAVTANFFVGNGSLLTGIAKASSADSVANGNSNVNILTANGNVTIAAVGNTVATITGTGVNIAGYVNATGNVTAANATLGNSVTANYFIGNGHYLTDILGTQISGEVAYANLANSVAGANVTGQVSNALVAGTVYTNAQPNITSVGNLTVANVTGNLTSGNANLGNLAIANYFSGSGNNLSNIQAANISGIVANANVANTAYSVAVANVSGIGNIATVNKDGNSSNILYGNGVFASAPVTYGNSNVATYLPTYTGNLSPGNLTVTTKANLGDVANIYISGGTSGQYLKTDGSGNLSWETVTASGGGGNSESTVTAVDNFTGDGVETTFTLSVTPQNINQTFVNYNGALQLRAAYTLSGADITFSEAPANGSLIEVTTTMGVTQAGGSSLTVRNYVSDGVQLTYTVSSGVTASSLLVTENGLVQVPTTDYTVSGSTLTFVTAPGYGVKIQIRELGTAISTVTPPGADKQVLFNDAGVFGHSTGLTYNKSNTTLSVNNIVVGTVTGHLSPSANITYDLGNATNRFRDLYLSGNTIDLAGAKISVNNTDGSVKLTPAATVANPTPVAQTISSPRYITMYQTGEVTSPKTGTSRYYPPKPVTVSNVSASLSVSSPVNLTFAIYKNGSNTGAYTINANSYTMSSSSANISLTTTDYLTVNILTGSATDLKMDLEYRDT
jgi:hypothetical protein